MGLENIVQKSKEFVKKNKKPLAFFTAATVLDTATTIFLMKNYGIDGELHPFARFVAENLGVEVGITSAKALFYTTTMIGAYALKDKAKYLIYAYGTPGAIFGIMNLIHIFEYGLQ